MSTSKKVGDSSPVAPVMVLSGPKEAHGGAAATTAMGPPRGG
jgi:hypothetical protein